MSHACGVRLLSRGEEVGVKSRVHCAVLLRSCCDQAALATYAGSAVGSGDVVETDVTTGCVQRGRVCARKS